MNTEYTPTTEAMRERLVEFSYEFSGVPRAETSAEFDRWLAGVIADAKAEQREDDARLAEGQSAQYAETAYDLADTRSYEDSSRYSGYSQGLRIAGNLIRSTRPEESTGQEEVNQ